MATAPRAPFVAADWYWVVAGSTTQVYSSKVGNYVLVSAPAYLSWQAGGRQPTQIASEADLGSALASYLLRPAVAGILDGYQDTLAGTVITQAIFKILFNHENRVRTIERSLALNGSPPNLTPAQARNAVKALM